MHDEGGDAELVSLILAGDARPFRTLMERHGDALYRFCLSRLRSESEAEDAVQDTFIRAYRSLGRYDASRSFKAWVFGIAANRVRTRAADAARRARLVERAAPRAAADAEERGAAAETETAALDELAREALLGAVAALPGAWRKVVELYYFGGLSVAEVAEALGLGREAVKSRLFRARKELASILTELAQPKPSEGGSA